MLLMLWTGEGCDGMALVRTDGEADEEIIRMIRKKTDTEDDDDDW